MGQFMRNYRPDSVIITYWKEIIDIPEEAIVLPPQHVVIGGETNETLCDVIMSYVCNGEWL